MSYTDFYDFTATGPTSYAFTLPGFDASMGILESVDLNYQAAVQRTVRFEQQGPSDGETFAFSYYTQDGIGLLDLGVDPSTLGTGSVSDPGSSDPAQRQVLDPSVWDNNARWLVRTVASGQEHRLANPTFYDGTLDYGGTSGFTIPVTQILAVNEDFFFSAPDDLAFFKTTLVSLNDFENSVFSLVSAGVNPFETTSQKKGRVSVTYNFTPIPEPSGLLLMGLAALPGVRRRRR